MRRNIAKKQRGVLFHRGSWWARLTLSGRQRWYKCGSRTQAKALYLRLTAERLEGRYDPQRYKRRPTSVGDAIESYLKSCTNRDRQHERYHGKDWMLRLGKATPLTQITHGQLLLIKKQMLDQGRSEQTVQRYFAFLKKIFNLAIIDHSRTGLTMNPCRGIKFSPGEQRIRRLTERELGELREILASTDYAVIELAIETLLRRGALLRWRWSDIDLYREEFTLMKERNKSKKTLTLPLSHHASAILKSLSSFGYSPWVFPSNRNPNVPRDAKAFYQDVYLPALRKRGIPIPPDGHAFHMLRHTGATRRLLAGCPLPVVRDLLGHSTIHMTLRYVNLLKNDLREGVEAGSLGQTEHGTVVKTVVGAGLSGELLRT